jgi:hypothetical protein
MTRDILTDRRMWIPDKTAFVGGNTLKIEGQDEKMTSVAGLTLLAMSLRVLLLERACKTLMTGLNHLNNLISPFLNSSNALACSWNMAMIESGLSQLSISEANGWSRRSLPVCLVYSVKAALKIASKLDEVKDALEAEDMGITDMSDIAVEGG